MEAKIWTVHRKGKQGLEVVPDRFEVLALIFPPAWAIWRGAWVILFFMFIAMLAAAAVSPLAVSPAVYGLGIIAAFEGGALRRGDLYLRGWKEVGVVEAVTEEGAEELYLTGQAA